MTFSSMWYSLHKRFSRWLVDAGANDDLMTHAQGATQNLEIETERLEYALRQSHGGDIRALTELARSMTKLANGSGS